MKPLFYLFAGFAIFAVIAVKVQEKFWPCNYGWKGTLSRVEVHGHGDLREAILDQARDQRNEKRDSGQETEREREQRERCEDREQRDRDYERDGYWDA